MLKEKKLNTLIIISMIVFLLISRNGEHISIPMFFLLIALAGYIFSDFCNSFPGLLGITGLILLTMSLRKQNKITVIVGYFLTYIILTYSFLDKKLYLRADKEIYFFVTTFLYLGLSAYVIYKILRVKSQSPDI